MALERNNNVMIKIGKGIREQMEESNRHYYNITPSYFEWTIILMIEGSNAYTRLIEKVLPSGVRAPFFNSQCSKRDKRQILNNIKKLYKDYEI